ncbi:MAG: hypothetical protein LIO96_11170 [Lachnospiraceae bacterium]|nr:hypothetical protein [Lachnospiraceae bacterium]
MRILEFNVSAQRLSKKSVNSFLRIVRGSKQYLQAKFNFSDDWSGMAKVAEFCPKTSSETFSVLIKDDICMVPDEVTDDNVWYIRLVGKKGETYICTNELKIKQEG